MSHSPLYVYPSKLKEATEVKIVSYLIITIVVLLSIAAGLAKVMQTQQEMEFLQGLGLSPALIVVFGLVQIVAGILLVPQKTRMVGALLAAAAFILSTVLIFVGGNTTFGLFSTLPIALAGVIIYQSVRTADNKSLKQDISDDGNS